MNRSCLLIVCVVTVTLKGCAKPTDYRAFLDHTPRSILVLPPLNQSAETLASDAFLSTVTGPLAECGYYVFPVAIVDRLMKENGLPTPGEMHQVPLDKLEEVFGSDAVLYVTIRDWKQQYLIVRSKTTVTLEYRLVDLATGSVLWRCVQTAASGGGGISVAGLIEAAAHALVSAASDEARQLAGQANEVAFRNSNRGLLLGERHPDHEQNRSKHQAQQEKIERAKQKAGR